VPGSLTAGSWLRSTPIAHRGLHDLAAGRPENSLAAFEHACRQGFPIELDVRLTGDGRAAVIHDDDLLRLTGEPGKVSEVEAAKLAKLRLFGTDQRVPLLDETLEVVGGRVPVLIEIKNTGAPGQLEDRVAQLVRAYAGEVALQSFNPRTLWYLRDVASGRPRGQLGGALLESQLSSAQRVLARSLVASLWSWPDFVGYELTAFPSRAARLCRRAQLPVLAWTVRSAADQQRARSFADNIIFEGFLPAPGGSGKGVGGGT
jgi:glycerophosphoryl diester phosphodiesterase